MSGKVSVIPTINGEKSQMKSVGASYVKKSRKKHKTAVSKLIQEFPGFALDSFLKMYIMDVRALNKGTLYLQKISKPRNLEKVN